MDEKPLKTEFSNNHPWLEAEFLKLEPEIEYSLYITAWKDKEIAYEDNLIFSLPDKKDESLETKLKEIETAIPDTEDPTIHLLKGNLLLEKGFLGEAFLAFSEYGKAGGKQDLATSQIRKTLEKMGFDSKDLESVSWNSFDKK